VYLFTYVHCSWDRPGIPIMQSSGGIELAKPSSSKKDIVGAFSFNGSLPIPRQRGQAEVRCRW
jgi:hypothetical protein